MCKEKFCPHCDMIGGFTQESILREGREKMRLGGTCQKHMKVGFCEECAKEELSSLRSSLAEVKQNLIDVSANYEQALKDEVAKREEAEKERDIANDRFTRCAAALDVSANRLSVATRKVEELARENGKLRVVVEWACSDASIDDAVRESGEQKRGDICVVFQEMFRRRTEGGK
jgi:hypothetical protein